MREQEVVKIVHRCIDESPRISRIESDISTLKADVSTLKADVSTLKDEQRRQGIMIEDLRSDMQKVVDVVLDTNRKVDCAMGVKAATERHADRLDAVEDGLRRHVRNRRAHRSVDS